MDVVNAAVSATLSSHFMQMFTIPSQIRVLDICPRVLHQSPHKRMAVLQWCKEKFKRKKKKEATPLKYEPYERIERRCHRC